MSRSEGIKIHGNILKYKKGFHPVGIYIAAKPLTPENNYFSVTIIGAGMRGNIGLGLVDKLYPLHCMPGWRNRSVGYHADDGRLFEGEECGRPFGQKCTVGDTMGCGVDFTEEDNINYTTFEVFFTRNGTEIGRFRRSSTVLGLFPAVGMWSFGETVEINLHAKWKPTLPRPALIERIHVDGDILRYAHDSFGFVGAYIAAQQLTPENNYFEVLILDTGMRGSIGVGLVHDMYSLSAMPGWQAGSVGYHADDGMLFEGCGQGRIFGAKCGERDVIGCGIIFQRIGACSPNTAVGVFFTRNGQQIGTVRTSMPAKGLYPAVGMLSQGETVQLNLHARRIIRPNDDRVQDASDQMVKADKQCTVCWDAKTDHAMVPCGHSSFCGNCANAVFRGKKECPICRARIENVLKLY